MFIAYGVFKQTVILFGKIMTWVNKLLLKLFSKIWDKWVKFLLKWWNIRVVLSIILVIVVLAN